MGWRYEWVAELDTAVYDVLLEHLMAAEKAGQHGGESNL